MPFIEIQTAQAGPLGVVADVGVADVGVAVAGTDAACCAPATRAPIEAAAAEKLARRLKALADPARLRLVSMVASHPDAEACVCDLTEPLELSQPTVSHHLKVLVEAGLLTRDKRGTWAYYRLVPGALDGVAAQLAAV